MKLKKIMEETKTNFKANTDITVKKGLSSAGIAAIIIAIVAFVIAAWVNDPQSSLKLFCYVAGSIAACYGIIKLCVGNKKTVCVATGKTLKKHDIIFKSSEISRLQKYMEEGEFEAIAKLERAEGNQAGARLRILLTDDHSFAVAQIFEFIPFNYEPVSAEVSYTGNQAEALAKVIS